MTDENRELDSNWFGFGFTMNSWSYFYLHCWQCILLGIIIPFNKATIRTIKSNIRLTFLNHSFSIDNGNNPFTIFLLCLSSNSSIQYLLHHCHRSLLHCFRATYCSWLAGMAPYASCDEQERKDATGWHFMWGEAARHTTRPARVTWRWIYGALASDVTGYVTLPINTQK